MNYRMSGEKLKSKKKLGLGMSKKSTRPEKRKWVRKEKKQEYKFDKNSRNLKRILDVQKYIVCSVEWKVTSSDLSDLPTVSVECIFI